MLAALIADANKSASVVAPVGDHDIVCAVGSSPEPLTVACIVNVLAPAPNVLERILALVAVTAPLPFLRYSLNVASVSADSATLLCT